MKVKAVYATEENFRPYGIFRQVIDDTIRTGEGGWRAWMTKDICMDDVCNIGITYAKGLPFLVSAMESHSLTQEVLVCGDKPMVLAVADTDAKEKGAKPEDIRAFMIKPGQVITLHKGIWHAACRSAEGEECYYYFLAHSLEPAVFIPIDGEVVEVEL